MCLFFWVLLPIKKWNQALEVWIIFNILLVILFLFSFHSISTRKQRQRRISPNQRGSLETLYPSVLIYLNEWELRCQQSKKAAYLPTIINTNNSYNKNNFSKKTPTLNKCLFCTRHVGKKHLRCIRHQTLKAALWGKFYHCILQSRKQRCREVKQRAYGPIAEKCGVQIWTHAV